MVSIADMLFELAFVSQLRVPKLSLEFPKQTILMSLHPEKKFFLQSHETELKRSRFAIKTASVKTGHYSRYFSNAE